MEIPNSEHAITLFCWDAVFEKAYGLSGGTSCVGCNVKNFIRFDCGCGFKSPSECLKPDHSIKNTAVNGIIEHLKESHDIDEATLIQLVNEGHRTTMRHIRECATIIDALEHRTCKPTEIFNKAYKIRRTIEKIEKQVLESVKNKEKISLDDIALLNNVNGTRLERRIRITGIWIRCINYFAEVVDTIEPIDIN